jgi:hypothetical protein
MKLAIQINLVISRQSAHRRRQVCQPYAPTALYSQEVFWYSSLLADVSTRRLYIVEGLGQLKIPVISSGIETATLKLVAQCLYQLRYPMLPQPSISEVKYVWDTPPLSYMSSGRDDYLSSGRNLPLILLRQKQSTCCPVKTECFTLPPRYQEIRTIRLELGRGRWNEATKERRIWKSKH